MTSAHSNAPSTASSGVIHIRARQTSHFTVLANRLAQRAGSAVTVGVAAYILSLPDGAPITIQALCTHFAEGKIVIAAALRELESEGWLERRVERGAHGRMTTRTFAYDLPEAAAKAEADGEADAVSRAPEPPRASRPGHPGPVREPEPESTPAPASEPEPQAADLLALLHHRDRRLLLSEREIAALAPAVTEWLDRGIAPQEITSALTGGLPQCINRRPDRLLAHRLAVLRPPARTSPAPPRPDRPPVVPLQNCDSCDRAFRADRPGCCRDCRAASPEVSCAA
ncbi:hypothetical protein AB0I10_13935 [Streptomyces sp. NPDC050636]|uniref:hypothetical protein n=1 Tax=Streptomyces sp. NPDC050636 TaxID=3154510 RepID=UPI0034388F43